MIQRLRSILIGLSLCCVAFALYAKDDPACKTVRMSDVGWTDISATTALAAVLLESLGYQVNITQMSVPVTFASMKKGDIDVFLGDWMPSMTNDIKPYLQDGSIESLTVNLNNAHYTLAVDKSLYDAGLHDVKELYKFKDQVGGLIYGIESGNEGNRRISQILKDPQYHLDGWQLIESSEAGMMSQLAKNNKAKKHIVFLGWEPHPMNSQFKIAYLSGFGSNYDGQASVNTVVRQELVHQCPNLARFFRNLKFTLPMENQLMDDIINKGLEPKLAAKEWMQANPDVVGKWLDGVTSFDGSPAL